MWSGVPREPYDSSTVMSYELGMRSNWLDDSLVVNGALFFNDMSKEQMQSWDYENFTGKNLNLDARSAGFELDARYLASRNWWMEVGVAYTYSSLRHVSAEAAALQDGLRSGNRLPSVPEWTARTALGYEALGRELGFSGWLAEQRVNAMLTYNFVGSRFTDASNFGRLAPVHLISARLGIDWGDGEFYLFGDNLLDKRYMTIKDRFGTDPRASRSTAFPMRAVQPSGWGWCCASDAGMHGRCPARLDSGRSASVKPGQALQINPLRANCVPFRVER